MTRMVVHYTLWCMMVCGKYVQYNRRPNNVVAVMIMMMMETNIVVVGIAVMLKRKLRSIVQILVATNDRYPQQQHLPHLQLITTTWNQRST